MGSKIIKDFIIEPQDLKRDLKERILWYKNNGFRVFKPATRRCDILYPRGKHRTDKIDQEILMLCYWYFIEKNKKTSHIK